MNFKKCIFIIVFGSLWLPNTLFAQNAFEGTQFVAPLYYLGAHSSEKLELISATNNCVRIQIPTSGVDTSFSVVANTPTYFDLDDVSGFVFPDSAALAWNGNDSVMSHRFELTTTYPIQVSRCFVDYWGVKLSLLPSSRNESYMIVDGVSETGLNNAYLFITSAQSDSFKIEANDSLLQYYYSSVSVKNTTFWLNSGQSLALKGGSRLDGTNENGNTGYNFSSSSPLSIVAIGENNNVKKSCTNGAFLYLNASHIVQKPNSLAGHYYFVTPMASYNNYFNLVALEDSTDIFIDGSYAVTINATESLDSCLTATGAVVSSNKPIQLGQFVQNRISNNIFNDIHGIGIQAADTTEFIHRSIFTTYLPVVYDSTYHNLNIITKTADTALLTLNGSPLSNPGWQLFGADVNYAWCRIRVPNGIHEIQSPSGFHGLYLQHSINITFDFSAGANYLPGLSSGQQLKDSSAFYYQKPNLPKTKFEDGSVQFCGSGTLTFYHNMARHTTWHWHFGDGTDTIIKVENEKPNAFAHTFLQPGQYWVTVQDSAGCAPGDSLLVEVLPNPTAAFAATSTASCTGTFVQLQNQSTGTQEYFWQWPNGSSTAQNPNFQYVGNETEIEITLIAKSENCSDTATQTINVESSMINFEDLANVITPNNDGINDAFCIPHVAGFAECFELQIFNRWGQGVFSTQNPHDCWRGQFQNQPAADGVYFYVLQLAGQTYQGEVTVMGGG